MPTVETTYTWKKYLHTPKTRSQHLWKVCSVPGTTVFSLLSHWNSTASLSCRYDDFIDEGRGALVLCYLTEILGRECACWVWTHVYVTLTHVFNPCPEVLLLTALCHLRFQSSYWGVWSDIWNVRIKNQVNNAWSDILSFSLQWTLILPDSVLGTVDRAVNKTERFCPHRAYSLVRGDSP